MSYICDYLSRDPTMKVRDLVAVSPNWRSTYWLLTLSLILQHNQLHNDQSHILANVPSPFIGVMCICVCLLDLSLWFFSVFSCLTTLLDLTNQISTMVGAKNTSVKCFKRFLLQKLLSFLLT